MTKSEIKDFKKFINKRNIYLMFTQNYRNLHLSVNPTTMDEYLEKVKAENVIPQAFIYPKSIYGKEFWLAMHDEWNQQLVMLREKNLEKEHLECLDLEFIDIKPKTICSGLPKNTCSLSLKGGYRLTFNMEHSKMIAKKLSTHMMLTRSRKTTDVVLIFNRERGVEVKFKSGTSSLQFNNKELANSLIELLDLDSDKEYFHLNMELLTETKDYLLFVLRNKFNS